MYKIRVLVIVLSVFGCVLLNSSVTSAQIRTVLVSPVPGNPVASGTALQSALAGISSPSATNRWLLKIEPGIYDIQSGSLQMRPWVDVEGSGTNLTTIRSTGTTIIGASDTELRMLTVEAIGNPGSQVIAMFNENANPRVYRVKFVTQTTNSEAWGMRNWSSAPKIEECEFSVSGGIFLVHGVTFVNFISTGARSSIVRSHITVSGEGTNYGVYMVGGQTLTEMQNTRIDVIGGSATYGIFSSPGGWQGSEALALRDVVINSAGGSQNSAGISLSEGTTVGLDIYNSKIWGHVAPTTIGILQGGNIPVGVRFSSIVGFTKTLQSAGNVSIGWTDLIGGPVTVSGWLGCIGVGDEMGVFYPNSCPQ
jgi:hypothetical protein